MNIVNKLTLRQLLLNKRRTLVTIIGTIISVAMITAVASLGVSFMDMMQRQVIFWRMPARYSRRSCTLWKQTGRHERCG